MKRILFTGLLSAFFAANAQVLPLAPSVKTGKLSNGFTYFIRKNTEPQKRATLYLVLKAGSVLERDNQRGLAHFMEHMSFNGTKHFPKNELVEYLQKSGIRFGADLNAYTSFDETVYQLPIPTDDPVLFRNGLQIMRDWAGEATLEEQEIDKERGVVLEEKRLRKGAQDRLLDQVLAFQVNNSRYGNRLPIGTEEVLNHFKRKEIRDFYDDWYRPDLEALIIVGDVDVLKVEKAVKDLFSDMRNPQRERQRTVFKANMLNKSRYLVATDPEVPQTSVSMDFKTVAIRQGDKAAYKENMLRNLCGQLLNARLSEISKMNGSPLLSAQGTYGPVINGLEALSVEYSVKDGQFEQAFDKVYGTLLQIRQHGFTTGEIDRVKSAYLAQFRSLLREKDRQNSGELAEELKRHFLTGEPAPGIVYENKLLDEILPQFTAKVIQAKVSALIAENNRDIIVTAPDSKKTAIPDEAAINRRVAALVKIKQVPYTEEESGGSLLSDEPHKGTIVTEKQQQKLGLTEWTLSNGARVILKPTAFKNDEIYFSAFSPGGTSLYSDEVFESATNAAGIIGASGLGKHDAVALPKLLSGKQVKVQPYIAERWEGIEGVSSSTDLETAMQLIHGYFTEPRKDSARFSMIISRAAESIAGRYQNPQAVFQDSVSAVLGSYHSRRTGPSLSKLNRISLDKAYQIYRERFADAGDFTFVFTGSFKPEAIRPLVEKYMASLPGGGQKEQAKDLGISIPEGQLTKKVYAGKEDQATVLMVLSGKYDFSPETLLRLNALKDVIQFRMTERLRETEGGAYSPAVELQREHSPDDRYQIVISFGCAPANCEKLAAAALEEIAKIRTDGPIMDDLQKFRSEELRQLELNKQDNRYWLSYLTTKLQNGEDINDINGQVERIKAISAKDIQEAAKIFVSGKDLIRFEMLPVTSE